VWEEFPAACVPQVRAPGALVADKLIKQIAGDLGVAERTVKSGRASAMTELWAGPAAELGWLTERLGALSDDSRRPYPYGARCPLGRRPPPLDRASFAGCAQ
jgi:hypothetical protein